MSNPSLQPSQQSNDLIPRIINHLTDVLRFVITPAQNTDDEKNIGQSAPPALLKLLMILDASNHATFNNGIVQHLPRIIALPSHFKAHTKISIVYLSSSKFLESAFLQRFDLGFYIVEEAQQNSDNETDHFSRVAIRLRDLFAEQSLLYLPSTNTINLSSLGYTPNDVLTKNSHWQVWQFNLYDYKPTPDWLNSKYWANPENFDKYRW